MTENKIVKGRLLMMKAGVCAAIKCVIEQDRSFLLEDLTSRELDVLSLLAEGLTNKAIAQRLRISEYTVKFHVNTIFRKLGVQNRTEAAVRAARLGLITL